MYASINIIANEIVRVIGTNSMLLGVHKPRAVFEMVGRHNGTEWKRMIWRVLVDMQKVICKSIVSSLLLVVTCQSPQRALRTFSIMD